MKELHNKKSLKEVRRKLRSNMTESEIILWSQLKNKKIQGLKFRRQHSIGSYILDFYCPELKLAIELDGNQHFYGEVKENDQGRDEFLNRQGIEVIRISNNELYKNIKGVVQGLWNRRMNS